MKKSYFYGDIKEQTFVLGYKYPEGFDLGEEYTGVTTSIGYWHNKERRYERLIEKKIFFWDVLSVEFEVGMKVKIEKEIVKILDVIHRLDGSIEYYTDKLISMETT